MSDPTLPPPPPPVPPPIEEWTLGDPPPTTRLPAIVGDEVELLTPSDREPPVVPVMKPRPPVEELPEARPIDAMPVAERVVTPTVLSAATFPRPVNPGPDLPAPEERPQARVILALGVLLLLILAMVAAVTVLGYTLWAGFQKARPATGPTVNQPQEQPRQPGRRGRANG